MTRVLAIDGSPTGSGRTRAALDVVSSAAAKAGASVETVELGSGIDEALEAVAGADAFIVGSPTYRGSFAAPLKEFLDRLPRGMWGETDAPITARAVAIVMTGATWHHYLALGDLRNVLVGFFAAHVLAPGLYVPHEGFTEDRQLHEQVARRAARDGAALVALAEAIARSDSLASIVPQA